MARLLSFDMRVALKEIAGDRKLLAIFAGQLSIRMNNNKRYSADEVVSGLGALSD